MQFEICGLGNALMDVLVRIDSEEPLLELNLSKGTMHLVDEARWQRVYESVRTFPHETHPGGSCANVISTTALLGAETAFCGQVGRDSFGLLYSEALKAYCGRHFLHLRPDGHTGKCMSLITPDAERTLLTTLGCAIELEEDNLFYDVIPRSRYFHLTAYTLTGGKMAATALKALEHARAHGVKVSFDVADSWVIQTYRDQIWEVIERYADVVFTNADEARALCNLPPEEAVHQLAAHCHIAVVKLGRRGSLISSGGHTLGIDVFPVDAVDTTGAGDAYAGGFLHGLVRGYELERCGRLASRVAAETVTQTGAVVTSPGRLAEIVRGI